MQVVTNVLSLILTSAPKPRTQLFSTASPPVGSIDSRQLLDINPHRDAGTPAAMRHHGRMHTRRIEAAGVTDSPGVSHLHRRVTSFRTRRTTLSRGQQETWERLWPVLGRQARDADGRPAPRLDLEEWFGRSAPVVLEIGCGSGVSTLAMAQQERHLDFIAVEVYKRGLAQLLSAIDRAGVSNIRLIRCDGVDVLEHLLGPESLIGVRVFFPDPW